MAGWGTRDKVIVTIIILALLFWFSPFSEVTPTRECHGLEELVGNPAGAQIQPLCGDLIGARSYWQPIFPFKEKTNERIEFCRKNLKIVENSCNMQVDELLIEEYNEFFFCTYVDLDDSGRLKHGVSIDRYSKDRKMAINEWHTKLSDSQYRSCEGLENSVKK